jgi:hypothetical protein
MAIPQLVLSGVGVPPYSVRGINTTIEPIGGAADMRRTINGALVDLSQAQFRKLAVTISCNDQQPPACDGVWPGRTVTVNLPHEMCYLTAGGSPSRTPVAGTSRVEGDFTLYQPQIVCKVVEWTDSNEEWQGQHSWSMRLEEV